MFRVKDTSRGMSPFLAARHEFSNAFGDLARGKRNWQLVAFATTGTSLALALTAYRLASAAHVVPYVVQVDRGGQVVSVAAADRAASPDARLVALQLAQFLRAVRAVLPAPAAAAQAETIRRAYAFAAPGAAAFLNQHFADPRNDPRVLGTRLTREVDVTGVVRLPDSDVWRLRWTETERPTSGAGPARRSAWEGYVSVALVPPTSEATLATAALVALAAGPVSAQQSLATSDSAGAFRAPAPVGFVNDFAGVVPVACAAPMRRMIEEVRARSKGEIAVVTLPALGGRRLEDVSLAIARQWGVGYAGAPDDPRTNTGVLVLLVPSERRSRVELASGVRRFLSDSASGAIQDSAMVPSFRRKEFGVGLVRGVEAIAQRFAARFGFTLASAAKACDAGSGGT